MNRALLLLLSLASLGACASQAPYVTTVGALRRGATLDVRVGSATVNAYQPEAHGRRTLFTIAATALPKTSPPPAPRLSVAPRGLVVRAPAALSSLLVRVPDGVDLVVDSQRGDVNVTDIAGNANVVARHGNVSVMLPGYAQAAVGDGDLSVTMGATRWPGTLHFSTRRGNVVLKVIANAAFEVHLHTDDGSLFTDFALRGTSSGRSETIDGSVNGGGPSRIDVEASQGAIRLLRLSPQP
jgi:hypothetical protein